MGKPTILAVDDDPQVLAAVRGDLRARYAKEHRIVVAGSGAEALDAVAEIQRRGDQIALFLADQRMPGMEGTDFLAAAREHFPEARRVLLTAYADSEAAIQAINEVELHHYLLKPWDPPEDRLYPVIDDLLEDWALGRPADFDGIRVIGTRWSATTYDTKEFLARNQVPYRYLDLERDAEARSLLDATGLEQPLLPVVILPDGTTLAAPADTDLADQVGMHAHASAPFYDVVVIGAGPAGLAAGVYAASEGLTAAVLERRATGGQAGTSSRIENYLGFPSGISGGDLAHRATTQAKRLGAEILTPAEARSVRVEENLRIVELVDGTELTCRAVVVASGMKVRTLDVPGYERLTGVGVHYGATVTEAAAYRDEQVMIVGGANSAGQAAVMFARYAAKVTMLVRGESLTTGMSQYLIDQIDATANIEVRTMVEVVEVSGDDHLEGIVLRDRTNDATEEHKVTGLFIFVGAVPHSDAVKGLVETSDRGFIVTGPDLMVDGKPPKGWRLDRDPYMLETSVPGIFAAGDVRDGVVRRVASAVGQGSICISMVHQYLSTV